MQSLRQVSRLLWERANWGPGRAELEHAEVLKGAQKLLPPALQALDVRTAVALSWMSRRQCPRVLEETTRLGQLRDRCQGTQHLRWLTSSSRERCAGHRPRPHRSRACLRALSDRTGDSLDDSDQVGASSSSCRLSHLTRVMSTSDLPRPMLFRAGPVHGGFDTDLTGAPRNPEGPGRAAL
jgi:hypothetical protein